MADRSATSRTTTLLVVAAAGLALTAGVVALVLATAPAHHRALAAGVDALVVAVPIAVGLTALARRPQDRFAWLLVAAAALWSTVALAASSDAVLYSLGRVSLWIAEPVLVYVLLAFPAGRLTQIAERRVAAGAALLAAVLYAPTALLVQAFPGSGPGTTCGADCPGNALALTTSTPGFVDGLIRPLRETLLIVVYVAVTALLVRRAQNAGPL